MNIIQTFWTGPSIRTESPTPIGSPTSLDIKAGWPSCEYHWMSWALSCLQAKKVFGEVGLVTDERGKEILIDRLGLPYTKVDTSLEKSLDHYPAELWSLAKIFSYSLQDQPFLHLDGDVFLWERPDPAFLQAGLIAQNKEKNLFFYRMMLDQINRHFTELPAFFQKTHYEHGDILAANAGFFGGSDLGFIKEYCSQAFEFIDRNFSHLPAVSRADLNFIFEQHLLYKLAEDRNTSITYYLEETIEDPLYKDLIRFEDFPFVKMIHPVGGFKRSLRLCNHLARRLRKEYPTVYYKIIDLVKGEGIELFSRIYLSSAAPEQNYDRTVAMIRRYTGTDPEREMLLEIYSFETAKNRLAEELYGPDSDLSDLYKADKETYDKIEVFFSLPEDLQLKGKVSIAPQVEQRKVYWDWKYAHEDQIGPMVERNCTAEKRPRSVCLAPFLLQMKIDEYYLDILDTLIVETVKQKNVLEDVMAEIRLYFEAEEINANPYAFTRLILESVKRLLYAGILDLCFELG